MPETTLDDLQYNDIRLRQNKRGYRSTEDSLILLYTIIRRLGFEYKGNAFEFGTGSGIISLLLAAKLKNITITAIEIQESLFELAKENIFHSGLEEKIILIKADGKKVKKYFKPQKFDCAFANPPFFPEGSGKPSPSKEKLHARYELLCTMDDVLSSFEYMLRAHGVGFLIYPVERLDEFLEKMRLIKHMKVSRIHFFKDVKHPTVTWKSSQKESDLSKWVQNSKLFVAEIKKRQ
ncbi:MAG: methyltransferase [Candidatus Celaenobacter polaris]|nr:methyltransferase [Candidatus Celaenobacter polaris]